METSIGPILAQRILDAGPAGILLVDGLGNGRSSFEALFEHPALFDVQAIAQDRILILPARISFGVAHKLINGLEMIADWLHPP